MVAALAARRFIIPKEQLTAAHGLAGTVELSGQFPGQDQILLAKWVPSHHLVG